MVYERTDRPSGELVLSTHPRARRGRGVLYATAPFVLYLLVCGVLFALSVQDLRLWEPAKRAYAYGALGAGVLAVLAFAVGARGREELVASATGLTLRRTPPWGGTRQLTLPYGQLRAFAIEPSLRSLGADVLWVAVHQDGHRVALLEGDPHSADLRQAAATVAGRAGLPLEQPRYTDGTGPGPGNVP